MRNPTENMWRHSIEVRSTICGYDNLQQRCFSVDTGRLQLATWVGRLNREFSDPVVKLKRAILGVFTRRHWQMLKSDFFPLSAKPLY